MNNLFVLMSTILTISFLLNTRFVILLQELVSIRSEGQTFEGDISVLGHVGQRVVCTPDFESLLNG